MLDMKKSEIGREFCIAVIALCLYGINKYYFRDITNSVFFKGYFNDIMCGIVFGVMVRVAFCYWFRKKILFWEYSILFVLAGIYWEYIAPLYLEYSVSDIWDIVAYLVGGVVSQLIIKKEKS